jgi:serine-type D-Ala-D-Ala carboxypeptidase (penicillin-binding protein 5/6)
MFTYFFKKEFYGHSRNRKDILYSFLLIIIPLALLFSIAIWTNQVKKVEIVPQDNLLVAEQKIIETKKIEVDLLARAAFVQRLNTSEIVYSKNEDVALPLASITKIMTALVAEKENPELNKDIIVNIKDLETEGEYGLFAGERFKIKDIIDFSLISSANDASSAIASTFNSFNNSNGKIEFLNTMNQTARKIGMEKAFFKNETGLDLDLDEAGAYASAKDVSKMLEYVYKNHPELLESTTKEKVTITSAQGFSHNISNTNEIINKIPGILGSKTGYTDLAGGNLAIVTDLGLNDPYIIVVLGSTQKGRFDDILKIIKEIIN